jgi:hypothetical protein
MIRMSRAEYLKDLSVFVDRISWSLCMGCAHNAGFLKKTCKRGAAGTDLSDE